MFNYLRLLQLRHGHLAPDTGAPGGEPGAGAQEGANGTKGASEEGTEQGGDGNQNAPAPPKTFSQADVDKIIARENAKWKRQQEKAIDEARTEAEKLASMSAEQRAQGMLWATKEGKRRIN